MALIVRERQNTWPLRPSSPCATSALSPPSQTSAVNVNSGLVQPSLLQNTSFFSPSLFMADSRLQSFAGSVLSHRVFLYSFASTLAVSATVINALQNQSNFYSVAVYLSKSGASVLVMPFHMLSAFQRSHPPIRFRYSPTLACSWL